MKANELRIGNFVLFKFPSIEDSVIKVTDIASSYIACNEVAAIEYKRIQPIELTEDWLEKFGFELESNREGMLQYVKARSEPSKRIMVRIHDTGCSVFNHSECNPTELQYISQAKYVHQLQNLYYALTGVELTPSEHETTD